MNCPELEILALKEDEEKIDLGTHPNWFKFPCSSLHVAPTKGGKTVVATNILFNKNFDLINKLDEIFIFSGSGSSGDKSLQPIVERYPQNIFDKYSDKKLQEILDAQLRQNKEKRNKVAIIIDDIAALGIKDKSLIWGLFTLARHYNVVWLHVMTQKLRMIPNVARFNLTYLMLGRINNKKELETIQEEFGGLYGKEEFQRCLSIATKDPYNFLWCKIRDFNPSLYHNFTKHLYTNKDTDNMINIDTKTKSYELKSDEDRYKR